MKISVVIPAYNEEKYLQRCLQDLMAQTRQADEIIIVDNNSTDSTVEIAKQFPNVRVVTEEKQGTTHARNKGFDTATGDVIARTDSDTHVPRNWLEKIEKTFNNNPTVSGVSGPIHYYDLPFVGTSSTLLYQWISTLLYRFPVLIGPNMAITKKSWTHIRDQVCLDDTQVHEDIDLSVHLSTQGKIMFVSSLKVPVSARRIKFKPKSFFFEYAKRYVTTYKRHQPLRSSV